MSISFAPCCTAVFASWALLSLSIAPNGNPTTLIGKTWVPFSASTAVGIMELFTQTVAACSWMASLQTLLMSSFVAVGASRVWSMMLASWDGKLDSLSSSGGSGFESLEESASIDEDSSELLGELILVEKLKKLLIALVCESNLKRKKKRREREREGKQGSSSALQASGVPTVQNHPDSPPSPPSPLFLVSLSVGFKDSYWISSYKWWMQSAGYSSGELPILLLPQIKSFDFFLLLLFIPPPSSFQVFFESSWTSPWPTSI